MFVIYFVLCVHACVSNFFMFIGWYHLTSAIEYYPKDEAQE